MNVRVEILAAKRHFKKMYQCETVIEFTGKSNDIILGDFNMG